VGQIYGPHLAPDVFRIAHMGDIRDGDIERLRTALRDSIGGRGR
jgi:aspartate aminotransferase-like enzyme